MQNVPLVTACPSWFCLAVRVCGCKVETEPRFILDFTNYWNQCFNLLVEYFQFNSVFEDFLYVLCHLCCITTYVETVTCELCFSLTF